jgi:polyisoprenoid-binding protein YceI
MRRFVCLALAAAAAITAVPAMAQTNPKPPPAKATQDPMASPAGTYALDARHVSVLLRLAHGGGFSYSVFRMGDVSGVLSWNPAKIEDCKVSVKIAARSLETNVPGFAEELTGPQFLNAALFPDATFLSTAIKRTGPTTGEITGNLTLHGVTRPLTLAVDLVGAGSGMRGPAIGFHAHGTFHRLDFGVGPVSPAIGDEVELVIDVEFDKTA